MTGYLKKSPNKDGEITLTDLRNHTIQNQITQWLQNLDLRSYFFWKLLYFPPFSMLQWKLIANLADKPYSVCFCQQDPWLLIEGHLFRAPELEHVVKKPFQTKKCRGPSPQVLPRNISNINHLQIMEAFWQSFSFRCFKLQPIVYPTSNMICGFSAWIMTQ